MANGKSNTARRREVRRTVPRPERRWVMSLRRREVVWAALYIVLLAALGSLIAMPTQRGVPLQIGMQVTEPIVSRVPFQTINKKETETRRMAARNSEPAVYLSNDKYLNQLRDRLTSLLALTESERIEQIPLASREQVGLTQQGFDALHAFKQQEGENAAKAWNERTESFLRSLFDLAILDEDHYEAERQRVARRILIQHPMPLTADQSEKVRADTVLYNVQDARTLRENIAPKTINFPLALQEAVLTIVMRDLQPTYVYDDEADRITRRRQQERYEQVPPVPALHEADTVLIPAGTTLSEADLELIDAERAAYQLERSTAQRWLTNLGLTGLVLGIALALWSYVVHYSPRIVRNPVRGLALTLLLLLCQVLAVGLTQLYPQFLFVTAVFPTLFAATVLAIAYDQRFALGVGVLHTLLVMLSLDLPMPVVVVLLAGVTVAVAQLREVRTRSKLVTVGLWTGLTMGVVTLLASLADQRMQFADRILFDAMHAAVTGLVTGILVQGILPTIEQVFKVTTAMTLKELNDASHPLLQRLAQEAPGTYQHSLRIADMAEAAADAIDADGLLCRVGAMYHDIGKINKPMYFIENQGGGPNRHGKLSPAMSLLIIVGHVKDGVEMAREYRLPVAVRQFIETHHGTTLVEYFYHAAKKQKEAQAAPGPSEFEFRYPGPKPQTREAAILLLCDGIEGAARALAEPTPIRLEQVVHKMAIKRLMDGQFDECNLTLQELHKIEQAINKTLCAIYHARIKYPGEQSLPPSAQQSPIDEPQPRIQPAAS